MESMMTVMCGVQFIYRKRVNGIMLISGLNKAIDQSAMASG